MAKRGRKLGSIPWNKGKKQPQTPSQNARRIAALPRGSKHHAWKGEEAGYRALHIWIQRQRGKPNYCEHCKTSSVKKRYDWANVSGQYLREVYDWVRLCRKCHYKYDH